MLPAIQEHCNREFAQRRNYKIEKLLFVSAICRLRLTITRSGSSSLDSACKVFGCNLSKDVIRFMSQIGENETRKANIMPLVVARKICLQDLVI